MSKCPYCLKPFKNVNPAHLVKHGKRLRDVYEEFPNWDIGKTSKGSIKGILKSKKHRKNISNSLKGRKITWGEKISIATKGRKSWNKGIPMSEETKKKLSMSRIGQRNSIKTEFKKNNNSYKLKYKEKYYTIHRWLRKNYGDATMCSFDNKHKALYDWALLKGKKYEYKRENFIQLCKKCHFKYDRVIGGDSI